jgi:hypothetical protein
MTAEERAKAIVAYFPGIPASIRPQLEAIIVRSIKRAVNQKLAELEVKAEKAQNSYARRGKQAKGRDECAVHWHGWWFKTFRDLRKDNRP